MVQPFLCLVMFLSKPARIPFVFQLTQSMLVNVFNDQFADDDEGNRQEHARGSEQFSPQDDTENNGNGMEVQGFSNQGRIDEVVIDLREQQVKASGL